MRVFVKIVKGANSQVLHLDVSDTSSVRRLKQAVAEEVSVDINQITLIFGGKKLEDQKILGSFLFNEQTVHMIIQESTLPPPALSELIQEPIPQMDAPIFMSNWATTKGFLSESGDLWIAEADVPVKQESLEHIIQIIISQTFNLALNSYGAVYSWGYNQYGQLGIGFSPKRSSPTIIDRLKNIRMISCGIAHGAAVDENRSVWVWGDNREGQCGLEDENYKFPTILVSMRDIKSVECGSEFTVLLDYSGCLYSFGRNNRGQLGIRKTILSASYDFKITIV
jgi:hypothetical protein